MSRMQINIVQLQQVAYLIEFIQCFGTKVQRAVVLEAPMVML